MIPLAMLIRQHVVPPTLVVKLVAPAAVVVWQQMTNAGKFYADYDTPWPAAGCKKQEYRPHLKHAAVFYATQLLRATRMTSIDY